MAEPVPSVAERPGALQGTLALLGQRRLLSSGAPTASLIAVMLLFGLISGHFLTGGTWQEIMSNAAQTCLVALGLTLVLMAGSFDLAVGASSQLATAVVASLLAAGQPLVEAFGLAVLVSVAAGAASGSVALGLRVPPFVGTLAVSFLLIGADYLVTAQNQVTLTETGALRSLGQGDLAGVPVDFLVVLVVTVMLSAAVRSRRFGLRLRASGLGPEGSFLRGVRIGRAKLGAFCLSGAVVGLGGVVAAAYSSGASGSDNSFAILLDALAAAFIGQAISRRRQFNLWGSLVGALFLSAVSSGLIGAGVSSNSFPVAEGVVVLGAVAAGSLKRRTIGQDVVV